MSFFSNSPQLQALPQTPEEVLTLPVPTPPQNGVKDEQSIEMHNVSMTTTLKNHTKICI